MNPELLDRKQADTALRDLMPIVDILVSADALACSGGVFYPHKVSVTAELVRALEWFRRTRSNSPAVKAYMRWLEQNTKEEEAKGT